MEPILDHLPDLLAVLAKGPHDPVVLEEARSVFALVAAGGFAALVPQPVEESLAALKSGLGKLVPGFRHLTYDRRVGLLGHALAAAELFARWPTLRASGAEAWVSAIRDAFPAATHPGPLVEIAAFVAVFPEVLAGKDPGDPAPRLQSLGFHRWNPRPTHAADYFDRAYLKLGR